MGRVGSLGEAESWGESGHGASRESWGMSESLGKSELWGESGSWGELEKSTLGDVISMVPCLDLHLVA